MRPALKCPHECPKVPILVCPLGTTSAQCEACIIFIIIVVVIIIIIVIVIIIVIIALIYLTV